ncbi:uncharacterized protein LOC111399125 isoform X2 [Olea europaea var. sylvestris]|uniref:uncharacterized protein LOC111399125 isoform X2 n=1 Tax=Olea europaea var. sylvestris TaxID=158386 RepID=UPI000C1D3B73|nr:uncharacterized protein LOC111399125 isoform X2 [Olea europaea var. sylvestris]
MKDNLTEASTRVTKGKAKFTMATKRDNVSKARTCVTKGISIGKNQANSSSFKGKKDFSEAIGKIKELSVNPSSEDIPRKCSKSNLPDSEDEAMQQEMEVLEEFHSYELCCKSQKTRILDSLSITDTESLASPPYMAVLMEQKEKRRKKFKASEERIALKIEKLIREMSPVHVPKSKGRKRSEEERMVLAIEEMIDEMPSVYIPKSEGSGTL